VQPLLHKTTTPAPGTPVQPGDQILVDITWDVLAFTAPDLHKALDCVYINGRFMPELSGGERPTPNDGLFSFGYVVPLDVPPGSEICDQGFVSGPQGWEEYGRSVSNVVCFPVEVPPPPPPPPPTPTCCYAAPEETTTTTVPEEAQPYSEIESNRPPRRRFRQRPCPSSRTSCPGRVADPAPPAWPRRGWGSWR
jgi:hypothetical protein